MRRAICPSLRNVNRMGYRFVEQIAHFVVGDLVGLSVADNVRSACHDCLLVSLSVPDELKALPRVVVLPTG